jgi:hypothetical protein
MNEQEMRFLEEQIPELAELAFKKAYLDTLAAGHSVLKCEGEFLYEVFPDGSKKVIKKMPPRIKVDIGQKWEIK